MEHIEDLALPVEVRALAPFRIWLRYSDGVEGEVDLGSLAGSGVFEAWKDRAALDAVSIDESRAICWGDTIDLCADALYLQLTGMPPQDNLARLQPAAASA